MQYQRLAIGDSLNLSQTVKAQSCPVCRIFSVDVADTSCEEIYAQFSDGLAFLRVSQFTSGNDTVFLTADTADLTLDGKSLRVCQFDHFLGFCQVLFEIIVRSVEHDRSKSGFDARFCAFIRTVVQMQGNWNGDTHAVVDLLYHGNNRLESAHVLSSAFRHAQHDRRLCFLSCSQDRFCPLEVVDVERTDGIMPFMSFVKHFSC